MKNQSKSYTKLLSGFTTIASFAILLNLPSIAKVQAENLPQNNIELQNPTSIFQLYAHNINNEDRAKIQIAILLDSSSSMDGLIDQARTQIWSVINALSKVTKNGNTPIIEVSLYHYGNDTLSSAEGFNQMLNELTTDLDLISENLFSIKTNGGQEYAGWAIDSAIKQLDWSDDSEDFRVIFIAGNEPFSQGKVNWQKAISSATKKGIIVNTIYCGDSETIDSNLWATAASQGQGNSFNLNQDREIAVITTPYDAEIEQLNWKLNRTYIPYGINGQRYYKRQNKQDNHTLKNHNSKAMVERTISKASSNYRNSTWDLVDAFTHSIVDLEAINKNSIVLHNPGITTQMLSIEDIEEKIKEMSQKRAEIKAQITELGEKRAEYIAKHTPKEDVDETLDNLMITALYKQLEAKNFEIKK